MGQILQRYLPKEEQIDQCTKLLNGRLLSPKQLIRIVFGEYLRREAIIRKIQESLDESLRSVFSAAQPLAQIPPRESSNVHWIFSQCNRSDWKEHLTVQEISCNNEVLIDTLVRYLDPYGGRDLHNDPYAQEDLLYMIGSPFFNLFAENTVTQARLLAESIVTELKAKLELDAELYTSHDLAVRLDNGNLTIGLAPVLR